MKYFLATILPLFALSGFAGLVYESVWSHYLGSWLGHAAYAQTLVLCLFMGGMAIGSASISRFTERLTNPLLCYAAIELLLGVIAVLFHGLFLAVTDFGHNSLFPALQAPWLIGIAKWSIATLLILPQTIMLGATFPLIAAAVVRVLPARSGHVIASLYFVNSLGASIGVLTNGFVLVPAVGLPGAVLTAGIINILLALVIGLMGRRVDQPRNVPAANSPEQIESGRIIAPTRLLLICAALTGTASFIYEIVWIRMLNLVLGSSTHSFELMLSAFILGLALGSLYIRRLLDHLQNPVATLAKIQILMGILALLTVPLYNGSFDFMRFALSALQKNDAGYLMFNLVSHGIALAVMLPTTFMAGMTLPLITNALLVAKRGEKSIGHVYAANTLGAIAGAALAVQVLIPMLGLKLALMTGAAVDLVLGAVLFRAATMSGSNHDPRRYLIAGLTAMLACALVMPMSAAKMASGVYRHGQLHADMDLIFHRDGRTASIDVFRTAGDTTTIATNGKPDASIRIDSEPTADEPTMVLLGAIPFGYSDTIRDVANIGFGSGLTSHVVLGDSAVARLDNIEIEPAMLEGARLFHARVPRAFDDERGQLIIEDARTFFSARPDAYDLIISEPSNPWVSGTASLFSVEFYETVERSLRDDGLLVQWLHLYEASPVMIATIINALTTKFPYFTAYVTSEPDMLLIASTEPLPKFDAQRLFDEAGLRDELERVDIRSIADLDVRRLGDQRTLQPYLASFTSTANSDFFPVVQHLAVKDRYLGLTAYELMSLDRDFMPLQRWLSADTISSAVSHAPPESNDPSDTRGCIDERVTESSLIKLSRRYSQARIINDYFSWMSGGVGPPEGSMDAENLVAVRGARSIHAQCNAAELHSAWLPSLHRLAADSLPYLQGCPNNDAIWKDLLGAKCLTDLPPRFADWLTFYQAIALNDAQLTLERALRLLPESGQIDASMEHDRLVTAAVAASRKLGDSEGATALLDRLAPRSNWTPSLRLVSAHHRNAQLTERAASSR